MAIEHQRRRFRFRILDAMVLTTAIACGLAYGRSFSYSSGKRFSDATTSIQIAVVDMIMMASFFTWAIALLVAYECLSMRDAARGPGRLSALLIALLSTVGGLAKWKLYFLHHPFFEDPVATFMYQIFVQFGLNGSAGSVTIAALLTLKLIGVEDQRSDWLELAGRLLGALWIVLMFASPILFRRLP